MTNRLVTSDVQESRRTPALGRDFRLYATGRAVSAVGDRIALITLVFLVVHLSNGYAPALAAFYVVRVIPRVLGGLLAGVVVDHIDRRRLMIACDLVRGGLLVVIPGAAALNIWTIYPSVFVLFTLSLLFDTAAGAALPDVVPHERMTTANAILNGVTTSADFFYAVGGVLIFALGFRIPFFIDAATFFFSAVMISVMRIPPLKRAGSVGDWREIGRRLREGTTYVMGQPFLKWSALTYSFAPFAGGIAFVLTPLYANHVLAATPHLVGPMHGGAFRFSLLEIFLGVGALIGSVLAARLTPRWPRGRLFGLGLTGMGVSEAALAFTHNLYVALPILAVDGVFNSFYYVSSFTLLQTLTATEMRGRVLATGQTLVNTSLALGAACSGALLLVLTYGQLWFLAGTIVVLASLFVWLRPEVRTQA
ncbi:MAG: MFS transporter [Chloroflexota bacterium]